MLTQKLFLEKLKDIMVSLIVSKESMLNKVLHPSGEEISQMFFVISQPKLLTLPLKIPLKLSSQDIILKLILVNSF